MMMETELERFKERAAWLSRMGILIQVLGYLARSSLGKPLVSRPKRKKSFG